MTIALKITICVNVGSTTAQKMKISVEDFFSKCDQICSLSESTIKSNEDELPYKHVCQNCGEHKLSVQRLS